jgi:hypothetical protein
VVLYTRPLPQADLVNESLRVVLKLLRCVHLTARLCVTQLQHCASDALLRLIVVIIMRLC